MLLLKMVNLGLDLFNSSSSLSREIPSIIITNNFTINNCNQPIMDVNNVADSISSMKLTEPPKISNENIRCLIDKTEFDIENAKELLKTSQQMQDCPYFYFLSIQLKLLNDRLGSLGDENALGEYSKSKEILDLKRSATYWYAKLTKESFSLNKRFKVSRQTAIHDRIIARRRNTTLSACGKSMMKEVYEGRDNDKLYTMRSSNTEINDKK